MRSKTGSKDPGRDDAETAASRRRSASTVAAVRSENEELRRRVALLEAQLGGEGERGGAVDGDIETEHQNLAQLYVATYQLHAAVGFREVVQVITEIVLNLVGAARFVLFLYDERNERLVAVAGEGVDLDACAPVRLGDGVVGVAAARKERFARPGDRGDGPLVVVPLASADALVGAVVIEALLPHKAQLTAVDDELFALLATQAATALGAALLREQAPPEARVLDVAVARALLA
jgi:nitrate/nitrite-specific signal transduction histidine kinase